MIGDEPNHTTPLQRLRAALHAKAKSAPGFRFYSLYDKVYRPDVLQAAWEQCRGNGGAPGVDGQTFADIEAYGVAKWLAAMRDMMQRLKLTVNETKTHVCRMHRESFDFLGYTFGRMYSPKNGHAYQGARPSRKKVQRVCHQINDLVRKLPPFIRPEAVVCQVNQVLRGWTNYFSYGTVSPAYHAVQQHTVHRVRQWLQRKFKLRGRGISQFPDQHLEQVLGLLNPTRLRSNFSRAKRVTSGPRAGCRKSARPVR